MAAVTAAVVGAGVAVKSSLDAKSAQKDALKQQKSQNASNTAFVEKQSAQARADALPLFDQASRTRLLTGQTIQNIFSQALPAQADIFTQGNVGAQQALLAGLPQQQAAILGQTLDPNALQAQQFTPDFSFLQQADPFFAGPTQALEQQRGVPGGKLSPTGQPQPGGGAANLLSGLPGGGAFQTPSQTLNIAEQIALAQQPQQEAAPQQEAIPPGFTTLQGRVVRSRPGRF